ncbi:hypothetical protein TorRG33x02_167970 [Trema orientale]|uniref:Uncharacterized protein n=1 Tax=Trema orientale TaxID=63057 RepID=A0A2P5EPI2_TREOI|nr:hypothetical protein TorRG33x02_167970 [Trema orientale]
MLSQSLVCFNKRRNVTLCPFFQLSSYTINRSVESSTGCLANRFAIAVEKGFKFFRRGIRGNSCTVWEPSPSLDQYSILGSSRGSFMSCQNTYNNVYLSLNLTV